MGNRFREMAGLNRPQQQVQVMPAMPLGDTGYAVAGVRLQQARDQDGNFVVLVVAIGGRKSDLAPTEPLAVVLGEAFKMPEAGVAALFRAAEDPQAPVAPEPPTLVTA